MKNPYQTELMRNVRHRSSILHAVLRVLLIPKYLLWKMSEGLPSALIRLDEVCRVLTTPLRAIGGFIKAWAEGRAWKKLWVASPVLVMFLVGFTVFYINVNKNRGRAYAGYYQGAVKAMQEGDFSKSDSLFSKLIHHPSYEDNDQVLYRAMISAAQNGNTPRRKALEKKLVEVREFEPAKRWLVDNYIRQKSQNEMKSIEYIQLAQDMLVAANDAESASYWRIALSRLQINSQDFEGAIITLKADGNLTPKGYLLLAQVLVITGDNTEFIKVLEEMLEYIEAEDPLEELYFNEKVEGWALIAANAKTAERAMALLPEAMDLVDRKRALAIDRRNVYAKWLSELNIRMFRFSLRSRDAGNRRTGFKYFDQALEHGVVPDKAGESILSVVNSTASYSLLSGQILDVAVRDGGGGAHLALGMEAWLQNDLDSAELHFRIAFAVQDKALDVIRAAARDLGRRSVESQLDMAVFRGVNRSNYQRSQDLLDVVIKIDEGQKVDVSFDKCYIYSLRNEWELLIETVEPQIVDLSGNDLLLAYNWLLGAYRGLGDKKRVEEFSGLISSELRKQRNERD